jgi:hypothetical protein
LVTKPPLLPKNGDGRFDPGLDRVFKILSPSQITAQVGKSREVVTMQALIQAPQVKIVIQVFEPQNKVLIFFVESGKVKNDMHLK